MDTRAPATSVESRLRCFHVAVVGGGISGTLAATVLSRAGYDVCLVDRHCEYPRDFRAEHLDGAMIDVLRRLDVLNVLTFGLYEGETVTLARKGRIIGSAGTTNFGLRYETMVNRARAALPASARVVTGRVTSVDHSPSIQRVRLADGETISARLVVLATGQGYALCKQLGIQRRILRENHSLTFGFDIEPANDNSFEHSFLVYQREQIRDRIDYFTAFTMGRRTRVNLFTYRDYREPWTKAFLRDPTGGLHDALPGLEEVLGPYRALQPVEARPIDLYVSENHNIDGVVVIGDAFQASCPATGMGMYRLLVDIEQLSRVHIPCWLSTPGVSAAKLASFYRDPVKRACDAKSLHDSEYRRRVSTETSLGWRVHRTRVHAMERYHAWRNRLASATHPRIVAQGASESLVAG